MATMKFFNVLQPPTQGSDDGTYYVKNGDYIDTYLVSSGKVERLSAESLRASYDGRVTQVESDISQLESDVNLKEVKANKQNSLASDGTGTKFPTVDAVNEGLLLKANKQQEEWITPTLLNGFTGNVKYRKTQFGHLEIYGTLTSPNQIGNESFNVFSLPSGYHPDRDVRLEVPENAYYTFKSAKIVYSSYQKMLIIYSGQGGSSWYVNVSIPLN